MTASAYERLEARFARISHIENAERTLAWDRRTLMPPASGETRAAIIGTLAGLTSELIRSAEVGELLEEAAAAADLSPWQAANLREMRRIWRRATAMPIELQRAIAALAGPTESAWETARRDDDFASFVKPLRAYLALQVEASHAQGDALGLTPYDALLDQHEPGLTAAQIDPLFDDLAVFLPDLRRRVADRCAASPVPLQLEGPFPHEQQMALSRGLAQGVGFDFARGRLDLSAHPYTSIVPGDIRMTTRFQIDNVREGVTATIHESGHAMYEAGLPTEWRFQPVGLARGGALHESQAILFEMVAGRSAPFLKHLGARLRQTFGREGPAWSDANLLAVYRQISPGVTRIEADEISYPLHIILRYRIERRLLAGELDVADLRDAWNEASRNLLGAAPPTDALGCLQDPHWVMGYLGYFPVYALGALIAAQLFAAARRDEPGLPEALEQGDFSPLVRWTRRHIHCRGSFPASGAEIIEAATGGPLSTEAFKAHLEARHLGDGF